MTTDPFQLTGEGGKAYTHAHSADFRPPSAQANLRQQIVSLLASRPSEDILLKDIAAAVGAEYRQVYSQAKHLCMRSLALRIEVPRFRETKKNGKVELKPAIALRYVAPFSAKIGPGQGKKGLW